MLGKLKLYNRNMNHITVLFILVNHLFGKDEDVMPHSFRSPLIFPVICSVILCAAIFIIQSRAHIQLQYGDNASSVQTHMHTYQLCGLVYLEKNPVCHLTVSTALHNCQQRLGSFTLSQNSQTNRTRWP